MASTLTGYFADVKNNQFKVTITSNYGSTTKDIDLAFKCPVSIKRSSKLYKQFATQEATISIVTEDNLSYLFTNNPNDSTVKIEVVKTTDTDDYNRGQVLFDGYLTPCEYDQDFKHLNTIKVEAVSKDNKLQYVDFDKSKFTLQMLTGNSPHDSISFFAIIKYALCNICGYNPNNVYIHANLSWGTDEYETSNFLSKLYINTYNFYEDDDDKTPLKYDKVLEEILKFINCTMVSYGDSVYIIDWDALKTANYIDFYNVNSSSNSNIMHEAFVDSENLDGGSSSDNFINISLVKPENSSSTNPVTLIGKKPKFSLDEVFNQITVEDNSYPIEEINISPFDNWKISYTTEWNDTCNHTRRKKKDNVDENLYEHVIWCPYSSYNIPSTWANYSGISPYKMAHYEVDGKYPDKLDFDNYIPIPTDLQQYGTNCEAIKSIYSNPMSYSGYNSPLCAMSSDIKYNIYDTEDSYFILNLSACATYRNYEIFGFSKAEPDDYDFRSDSFYANDGIQTDQNDLEKINFKKYTGYNCVRIAISVGDKYYHPTDQTKPWIGTWNTDSSPFYVAVGSDNPVWNDWMDSVNTVSYKMGLDGASGFAIQVPANTMLSGFITVHIYRPIVPGAAIVSGENFINWWGGPGKTNTWSFDGTKITWAPDYVIIKGLELEYYSKVYNKYTDTDYEDDISYKVKISDEIVNEGEKIELKINTQDNDKKLSYSSVLYKDETTTRYVDKLYHLGSNKMQKQEYNIIECRYNHYSTPKVILSCDLFTYYNKQMLPYKRYKYTKLTNNYMMLLSDEFDMRAGTHKCKFYEI